MRFFVLTVVCILSSLFFAFAFTQEKNEPTSNTAREERMFSFFSSSKNSRNNNTDEACGSGNNKGSCIASSSKCRKRGGTTLSGSNNCSNGRVCCQIIANCTGDNTCTIRTSGTTVQQLTGSVPYRRTYRYIKPSGICQLRLDFDEFMLAGPDTRGECKTDLYQVAGMQICGNSQGQHVYVDFDDSTTIEANMRIRSMDARYSIRNTFIPCNSDRLAPEGCRQYYTEPEGRVTSFNYKVNESDNMQTDSLAYTVCIKPARGLNSIQWSECPGNTFFISGSAMVTQLSSPDCKKDWVQIYGLDRYCGKGFNSVTSTSKPFLLDVHFDQLEGPAVTLPTDPELCNGKIFDPSSGGNYDCVTVPGPPITCTCTFLPADPAPANPFDPMKELDLGNTGFCLDYVQM